MSFSALSGVALRLSRLFLKICRWVLVKMSLNCKVSGLNGSFSSSSKLKKGRGTVQGPTLLWRWKRLLLCLCLLVVAIGSTWFFSGLKEGVLVRNKETSKLAKDEARILLEHFNISKEQINALASFFSESDQIATLKCSKEPGHKILSGEFITCALKLINVENEIFEKIYALAAENVEENGQCPVQDDNNPKNLDMTSLKEKSLPCSAMNVRKARALENGVKDHCDSMSFFNMKACGWILIVTAIICMIPRLWELLWYNHNQTVQQQPLVQQRQLLQHHPAQIPSKSAGKLRKKFLVFFVSAGIIGSIWIFWYQSEDIISKRKETLASMCDERARMLQDQFNVSMNHVHALAILVSTFHHGKQPSAIDQKTFEEYTERTAFERPLTSGVAYALRVRHSEREQFEQQHGWTIKKMETEDQTLAQECIPENLDPSPIQDEYAPVIFSQKTVSHIVSIDMMSGKEDRENILRARASGKGVLTSPFKLLKSNHLGVVLTFAVYNRHLPPDASPDERVNATVGYLGASYDVPSLVEKLLHQLASKQTIVVNVFDTTNRSAPIQMFGADVTDTGLLHNSHVDFGDPARKHEMHCRFKQKPPLPWTAITFSVGVLVITLLLGHIFHAAINQIAKVESDYQEMMELKHRAEAADIAKSQFLATVSHEIRTPMNGVLGMLQMLMDTNLDADQLEYAQTAHESGKDLISLINEVLDQAKIESGRLELEAVPFDLRAVLDNVLSLFSTKSHEKSIELAVYVSDQVPEIVIGDPGRFRQILTNLVGNSIKFTNDRGHVFVSVHLADEVTYPPDVMDKVLRQSLIWSADQSNACYNTLSGLPVVERQRSWEKFKHLCSRAEGNDKIKLLVTVEDTGVGIPPEAQSRIFTPFMQADSSTSRNYGGTGIGLSISKRLVDLMSGEIGFVSERHTGSTFSFTATFRKAEKDSLDNKWRHCYPAISEFRGLRVLVLDDKSMRAEVTRYHLQRLGISVEIASTMNSACFFLSCHSSASENIAVVLVDKDNWSKETCVSFRNLLKEFGANGSTGILGIPPKLVATCLSSTEGNELKSAGLVDNVLLKPLRLSVLISCLQESTGFGNKRQIASKKLSSLGDLLRGKRILVVDDNLVNRKVAEGVLKKYGANVTSVDSGQRARDLLKPPHDFDACFMDLQMPEMDGFEATKQIRDLERKYNAKIESGEILVDMSAKVSNWHTPILAMTADVIQATNEKCRKCGMDDYVAKPFEEGQLYFAVARFFDSG